jgi:hypothetical protein
LSSGVNEIFTKGAAGADRRETAEFDLGAEAEYGYPGDGVRQRAMTQTAIGTSEPSGIGGWLILPAIGIIVAPFQFAMNIFDYFPQIEILQPGTLLHTMTLVEVLAWVGFTILAATTAFQFFTFRKSAPRLYRALLVGQLLFVVAAYWAAAILFDAPMFDVDAGIAAGMLLAACAIWIPYFLYSVRVRNTFVR